MPLLSRQAFRIRSHSPTLEAAAEAALALTLRDAAPLIERPFMIVFGTDDRLIPVAQAERPFDAIPAPAKRFELPQGGNHVCNTLPFVWRPLHADWLAAHLAPARPPPPP